jgi:hypothetical protein
MCTHSDLARMFTRAREPLGAFVIYYTILPKVEAVLITSYGYGFDLCCCSLQSLSRSIWLFYLCTLKLKGFESDTKVEEI